MVWMEYCKSISEAKGKATSNLVDAMNYCISFTV